MSFCDPLAKVQHQHPCSQVGAPNQGWSQVLADVVEPHSSLPWAPSRWLRDDLESITTQDLREPSFTHSPLRVRHDLQAAALNSRCFAAQPEF